MADPQSPSTIALLTATAILAATAGYMFGTASYLGLFNSSNSSDSLHKQKKPKRSWPNSYDVQIHPDSSDEELMESLKEDDVEEEAEESSSADDIGQLGSWEGNLEECKMMFVVRTDLGMTKGKIAAQCSHAALANYKYLIANAPNSTILKRWQTRGEAMVAVQCKSEDELLELQAKALSLGLCGRVIHDAGRTQIAAGSATVLGVGPGPRSVIDQVTGGLKLL